MREQVRADTVPFPWQKQARSASAYRDGPMRPGAVSSIPMDWLGRASLPMPPGNFPPSRSTARSMGCRSRMFSPAGATRRRMVSSFSVKGSRYITHLRAPARHRNATRQFPRLRPAAAGAKTRADPLAISAKPDIRCRPVRALSGNAAWRYRCCCRNREAA